MCQYFCAEIGWKEMFVFGIECHYFAQIFLLCDPLSHNIILRHDFFQAHNLTMARLENGYMQLIHGNKVLYFIGLDQSLLSYCMVTEPIKVLCGQIIPYTCAVMLESSPSADIYDIGTVDHMDMEGDKVTAGTCDTK